MDDITDEDVAAIRAESAAYDVAHPHWREEAEAQRRAWARNRMPDWAQPRHAAPAGNADIKAWGEALLRKYQKGGQGDAVPSRGADDSGVDGGGDAQGTVVVLD